MGIGSYTANGYRLASRRRGPLRTGMDETLEPLWMEMDRPRETVRPVPYNRLQNPVAGGPKPPRRGPKMSVPDHRPGLASRPPFI
ncbi:membrane -like domain protein [Burkholderia cepacia]|nr:membrane -like domain protein [Burkholderia cepacia]KGB94773.1 membrane -like domain protein [Burkholderia cepacia]SOT38520.1 hypothetical protein F01_140014 [Burkholderia cenocepacia]